MNNNLEFENEDPSADNIEDNHPRTNYGTGRQERMYSEGDILEFSKFCRNLTKDNKDILRNNPDITEKELLQIWFEQFKKK